MRSYVRSTENRRTRLVALVDEALDCDDPERRAAKLEEIRGFHDWKRAPIRIKEYITAYIDLSEGRRAAGTPGAILGRFSEPPVVLEQEPTGEVFVDHDAIDAAIKRLKKGAAK